MLEPNNKFKIAKATFEENQDSFFRAAEMDLSSPQPKKNESRLRKNFSKADSSPVLEKTSAAQAKHVFRMPRPTREVANQTEYEKFKHKRDELTDAFTQTAEIMQKLNMLQLQKKMADLRDRIQRDTFKIQIVGNFKNGKSTFINSFLGEDVLPAYALPCTAVINEVKYGAKKRGIIHFKNPLPNSLPSELSPAALKHIRAHLPGPIPPLEVSYDKIEEYVVIPVGKDPRDMLLESPYERVELFWPLELLKNGIEIIDSPGLNEHTTRTKVTMDFLTKSDAIIFVLNATMLCSRDEMNFIEKSLHANGFKDLFFVVNRFDMIPDAEKNRIMEYAKKNLVSMTGLGEKGIFFVSAKNALQAKMEGKSKALAMSGMPEFERKLSLFLTKKKGSMKLASPARAVLNFLQEETLKKILPQHRERLSLSSRQIGKDCDVIQANIKMLGRKKELFRNMIQMDVQRIGQSFRPMAKDHLVGVTNTISYWLQNYIPSQPLSRDNAMFLICEMMEQIRLKLEENNLEWCKKVILPPLSQQKETVFSSVESQVKELVKTTDTATENAFRKFNTRFLTTAENKEEMSLKTVTQITATPLLIIMTAFSSAEIKQRIYTNFQQKRGSSALLNLKAFVVSEVVNSIQNISHAYSNCFAGEISEYFGSETEKTLSPIDDEIASLQSKFEMLSADNGVKKADLESKKEGLQQTEDEVKQLCKQLYTYIESFKIR